MTIDQNQNKNFYYHEVEPTPGGSVLFHVRLRRGFFRPAWAGLCGALASGGLAWESQTLLRLGLLLFLVDLLWGALWSAVASTDWANPLQHWRNWRHGQPVGFIPYTGPDGLAGRLAKTQGQFLDWWGAELGMTRGSIVMGLVLALVLTLMLAGLLGDRVLLASLGAISLTQLAFVLNAGNAYINPRIQAVLELGLAWLAGHALFAQITPSSMLLAFFYTCVYANGLGLINGCGSFRLWNLGQLASIILMIIVRQPWLAGCVGVLFIVQVLPQASLIETWNWLADLWNAPAVQREQEEFQLRWDSLAHNYLRYAQPCFMLAMFFAALAVSA